MGQIKNEPLEDLPGEVEEGEEDTTDWKALAKKNHGIAKRFQTKLKKAKEKKPEAKPEEKKPEPVETGKKESFDFAEKAYMKTSDVKPNEFKLVLKHMNKTGDTLDETLDSKYFRAKQKEAREHQESKDATPDGTKRTTKSTRDRVEYWLQKGKMPPKGGPEATKLRRKYVNAKIKTSKGGSNFTDRPVIGA